MFNWNHENPEKKMMRAEELGLLEDQQEHLSSDFVDKLVKDAKLIDEIRERGYPKDKETCDQIGERHGLGPEQVMAVSEKLRQSDQGASTVH